MVQKVSRDIGLLSSSNCPCAFGHASRDLEMVHGNEFIVAGSGDDLDWLSQKLNEKLKLAQKARLGPGHDREATVLNRYMTCSALWVDVGSRPARRRTGSCRAWTSNGASTGEPNAPLDHKERELDGQKAYHSVSAILAYLAADRPDIAFACKGYSRAVGKATRADLTRLQRIGRYLLHSPRAVREFPLQDEESITTIDGLSDADAAGCTKTRRSTSRGCLRVGQHNLATWSLTQKVVSLSSAESEYYSMLTCASEALGLANTIRESWDTKPAYESGQTLQQHEGWLSAVEAAPSNTWKPRTCGCSRRRKIQELRIEKIRGTVIHADLMTQHLDGKRLTKLCELLERQSH